MSKKIVPFVFSNRDCPACGGIQTILFVDSTSSLNKKITSSKDGVYEVKCQKCNRSYIIEWNKNVPQLADKDASIDEFERLFTNNEKRNIDDVLFGDYIN